jgi:hypothetical protein
LYSFHQLRLLETDENLYKHRENTRETVKSKILVQWLKLFHSTYDKLVLELFNGVISKFIYVSASHYRKDFLRSQKIKSPPEKVMEKKESKTNAFV